MYPYSSTTLADSYTTSDDPSRDEVETRVQMVLAQLEQLPQDVQLAICTRLLSGLASKLTAPVVSKGITAARTEGQSAKSKASATRGRSSSRTPANDNVPRADSLLRQLNDPTDPIEAWQRFGGSAAQLFDVLKEEPTGVMDMMLTHRNMPAGPKVRSKDRKKIAEAIAVRLEHHFGRQSPL